MLKHLCLLGFLAAMVGCAARSTNNDSAAEIRKNPQLQVRQVLDEIFRAAETKDFERLDSYHLYGPMFSKFGAESTVRQDAEEARKLEHDGLASAKGLSMRADDLKIDVFGETAVVTFLMNYGFDAGADRVQKRALATMIFVEEGTKWKIVHEHFSTPKGG